MRFPQILFSIACGLAAMSHSDAAEDYARQRQQMVALEIEAAGVDHPAVLKSMHATPRHEFVPRGFLKQAYFDAALPIGDKQTISPPFVVAYMTQELDPQPSDRVLEIGTGSGYQAAVLSPLVGEVYTIEIVERLGKRARRTLQRLGYQNVHVRVGDGYQGWPEHAPFDKIIVTCSPEKIPQPLVDQLKEGGQMIMPVGERYQQNLYRVTKRNGKLKKEPLRATLFVPMTGTAESLRQVLPNPQQPTIVNGNFDELLDDTQSPTGWHYLRGAQVVGKEKHLSFTSTEPGQASRALQGLALDGRKISRVRLSARVRARGLVEGPTPQQRAAVIITFYDSRRAVIGSGRLGDWQGSFDWREESKLLRVPLATREAIVRLGLHGGVGKLDLDEVSLSVVE
ncbi:MAG: protein-L-isoaspartate(D-aspartate) O-methyltransferase [Pirellulales bacterium]|nr:protein-L-isoaspartate(D-aspartate) O-methyltransferase [Pirellulales bacterium]